MDQEELKRLEKNPHYKMSAKQRAQLRGPEVLHRTEIPRHTTDIAKHAQLPPKEKEGDSGRAN